MVNEIYLRRRGKVIVPQGSAETPQEYLVTFLANVQWLGCTFSRDLSDRLLTLDLDELEFFYKDLIAVLTKDWAPGAYRPMYPNFPAQVVEKSEAQLYWNAIVHYITKALPTYRKADRPKLDEPVTSRVIDLGDQEDYEAIFTQLAARPGSLSVPDRADLVQFVVEFRDDIGRLIPNELPFRETVAVLGAALLGHTSLGGEFVRKHVKTATDVLRLATALSGGDVSLAANTKFKSLPRRQRHLLLDRLEGAPNLEEDMRRWHGRWVRLGERLHPGEFANRYPKSFAVFKALRNNTTPATTFNSQVEASLAQKDAERAVSLLRGRPGVFARRLDHILRLDGADRDGALDAFSTVADKVSTTVLLQLWGHFSHRNSSLDLRVFFPKGDFGKAMAIPDELPRVHEAAQRKLLDIVESALVRRFGERPALGKCYLEACLRDYPVPFGQRSASRALATLPRGSRLPLPEAPVTRLFLWWKNGSDSTDIDLSAAFYDTDFKFISLVSYYQLKAYNCAHSGDIVDAPNGAAEYIDLHLDTLRANKVRYVVMSVYSYSRQAFRDLPECYAGWMSRQKPQEGEIFEPSTVQNKVDLAGDTTISLPIILDLEARHIIWSDLALRRNPRFQNNPAGNAKGVEVMLRAMLQLRRMSLYELFELHVKARGQLVESRQEADVIFSPEGGISPCEVDRIAVEFM